MPDLHWQGEVHAEREALLRQAIAATACDYPGLAVILDGTEYIKEERQPCRIIQGFGNYWNTIGQPYFSRRHSNVVKCPKHLEDIQEDERYQHFIWIDRSVVIEDDDVRFFWVVIHELRHYQAARDKSLLEMLPAIANEVIAADEGGAERHRCIQEMDCDLYACGLVVAKYGRSAALNYSRDQASKYREAAARADRPDAIAVRQHDAMRYDFIASRWLPATLPE
jgi:hypothetical protein